MLISGLSTFKFKKLGFTRLKYTLTTDEEFRIGKNNYRVKVTIFKQ